MRFGELPAAEAEGAILAHNLHVEGKDGVRPSVFKKGRHLSAADVDQLVAANYATVTVAWLDPEDIGENEAAGGLAAAAGGANLETSAAFTGRTNLFATVHGIAVIDRARLDRLNLLDEAVTIATVPPYEAVEPKQMVATIKIITFAVPRGVVEAATAIASEDEPLVRVAEFRPKTAGLIQTRLPGLKESILDKTTATITARLENMGSRLGHELRCDHEEVQIADAIAALRAEGCDVVLIAGASAITDRRDVVPAGIEAAGGAIDHFGMPVDPGNLLLLARHSEAPIVGMPGCVRSPKFNGFDWVLQRLLADIPVTGRDVMLMGSGGLLKEIPGRPMPRAQAPTELADEPRGTGVQRAPRIGAIVLAAGQSRRMGRINKLLAEVDGVPMVTRAADAAKASKATPVIVVTGHEAQRVRGALGRKRKIVVVHNPDYAEGLSTSLCAGLDVMPGEIDGVLVCLGDMPRIKATHLNRLIDAFNPTEGRTICVPTFNGKRGNPVLFAKRYFVEMRTIAGDVGARHLIGEYANDVAEVEMDDEAVLTDVDSPDALTALTQPPKKSQG